MTETPMTNESHHASTSGDTNLTRSTPSPLQVAGRVANRHARAAVFADYLARKADNTVRTQAAALALFADFLNLAGKGTINVTAADLQHDPAAWRGLTWGVVATVNNRLSVVKVYAKLASKVGVIDTAELQLIKAVSGYSGPEAKRVDERRETTRVGQKKADHVSLTPEEAETLKVHDLTVPQGRRDRLLMCLLLDHGLRVSEVAALEVSDFDLKAGELRFYRAKVDKEQTHKLTADTLAAAAVYIAVDAPAQGRLLLGSVKGGRLRQRPMSGRAITKRVRYLGRTRLGKETLSAHDCRHFWATYWSKRLDRLPRGILQLQEAGGWSSMAMPRRYAEEAEIANEGMA